MKEEDAKIAKDGQHPIDPTIIWIKQTVRLPYFTWFYLNSLRSRTLVGPWVYCMHWRTCVTPLMLSPFALGINSTC